MAKIGAYPSIPDAYLDNSATTRPTAGVVAAITACMEEGFFNPSSLYAPALHAERALNDCRAELAHALGVEPDAMVFTSGGTEANNLALLGAMRAARGPGHLITCATEHPSVMESARLLAKEGHRVTIVPVDGRGAIDADALKSALSDDVRMVSLMQVNNETGAVHDLPALIPMIRAHARDALIHVDGVQGFMRLPFDARMVDLYTLSAHKIHGPKGVGALYVRPGTRLEPILAGGGQEGGLRSGTENTPGIAGLRAAVAEMAAMPDVVCALRAKKRLAHALFMDAVPGAQLIGPSIEEGAPHILNMSFPPVGAEVMLHALEEERVYVSAGAACSSKKRTLSAAIIAMDVPDAVARSALRFSFSPLTGEGAIRRAAEVLGRKYRILKRYVRR